jgi:hypothetical protein
MSDGCEPGLDGYAPGRIEGVPSRVTPTGQTSVATRRRGVTLVPERGPGLIRSVLFFGERELVTYDFFLVLRDEREQLGGGELSVVCSGADLTQDSGLFECLKPS